MAISRKTFIRQSAFGAASVLLSNLPSQLLAADKKIKHLGLITGVLRKELKEDWKATLRKVSSIGYKYIEFESFGTGNQEEEKRFLKDIGLKPLGGGTAMAQLKTDDSVKQLVEKALFWDKKYLTCYWPWMDSGKNKKLDDFKKAAADLNRVGEICNKEGIRFAYHNHDNEFVPVEGYKWGYEVIMKETDPKAVAGLMDLYWVTKGGGDPVELFKKFPGRFELFHVKDMDRSPQKLYTCPGYGQLDFKKIFSHSKEAGVKYYIVEIDETPNPLKCVEDSYAYLKALRF
jgi:sugar phosphate isomerase/epimerase